MGYEKHSRTEAEFIEEYAYKLATMLTFFYHYLKCLARWLRDGSDHSMLDPLASSNHQENASKDMLTGQSDGNNSTVELFSSHKTTCQADKVNYDSYHILILSRH